MCPPADSPISAIRFASTLYSFITSSRIASERLPSSDFACHVRFSDCGITTMNGNFSYGWTFGKPVERPGGISFRSEGGALAASQGAAQTAGRYRLSLNANVQNLTNHANLFGYSGTLTSKNFGLPTSVLGTRKVDISMGLSF